MVRQQAADCLGSLGVTQGESVKHAQNVGEFHRGFGSAAGLRYGA